VKVRILKSISDGGKKKARENVFSRTAVTWNTKKTDKEKPLNQIIGK
jgi:hypothetical protein